MDTDRKPQISYQEINILSCASSCPYSKHCGSMTNLDTPATCNDIVNKEATTGLSKPVLRLTALDRINILVDSKIVRKVERGIVYSVTISS